jgi:hypothetical protein
MTLCVPMMTAMESQPDRRCDLDPAGEQPAPVRTRVLRNVDDGTAIFAAASSVGLALSIAVIIGRQNVMSEADFKAWG